MSIAKAMTAVFKGPEAKKLKVLGHKFNVKRAEINRSGNRTTAVGQISHHLKWRPDDQAYYTIVKEGNEITTMDIKISRGGAAPYVAKLISVASAIKGVPLPPSQIEVMARKLGQVAEGKWEDSVQVMVSTIALKL